MDGPWFEWRRLDHRLHGDCLPGQRGLHHDRGALVHGQRPDQRHGLHLHRHRDQQRRHRAGVAPFGSGRPTTDDTVPGAPTGTPTGVAGNGSATVSWTAPGSNGGASITGYTVTAAPGGATCTTTGAIIVHGQWPDQRHGLHLHRHRDQQRRHRAGVRSLRPPSPPPPAPTAPGAPTGVTAVAGNASATVSWTAPANGGATITGYTVTASPGGATATTTGATTVHRQRPDQRHRLHLHRHRHQQRRHRPRLRALQPPSPAAGATAPAAPTGSVRGVPGNASATVSWTAPASTAARRSPATPSPPSPGGATCTTTGTTSVHRHRPDQRHRLHLHRHRHQQRRHRPRLTALRTGDTQHRSGAPGTPTAFVAGSRSVTVSWIAPPSDGGSPITRYTVTTSPGGKTCSTTGPLSCTVTGLHSGTTYTFTVTARNSAGIGPASQPSAPVTP